MLLLKSIRRWLCTAARCTATRQAAVLYAAVMGGAWVTIAACQAQQPPTRGESEKPQQLAIRPDRLISGPQVAEPLPMSMVWMTSPDEKPSEKVDLAVLSKQGPLAVLFMHEKSRPAFALARLMSEFTARRKTEKLQLVVVVLTDDRSTSEHWLGLIRRYFPEPTQLAVAEGGIEGPGTLGLNRLAAVTILVAQDSKIVNNFALTQVSEAADGPAVLEALNKACGGGDIPPLAELRPQPNASKP